MNRSSLQVVLTVAALAAAGCSLKPEAELFKKPIELEVEPGGKVLLYVAKGEVIHFKDNAGGAFKVTFAPLTPCSEGSTVADCTTKEKGYYLYQCPGCSDPAIVVGPDASILRTTAFLPKGTRGVSAAPGIYCDPMSKVAKAYPDPLKVPASTAGQDTTIQWLPLGSSIKKFTVKLDAGICQEAMPLNETQSVCTLLTTAPKALTNYQVTADACTGAGSAQLQIQ